MRVELTTSWPWEKFAPYGPAVTAAMHKLRDRYPREVSVPHLAQEIQQGKRDLWLILDDNDKFVSYVLSNFQTMEGTGCKSLLIPSFAGDEGAETVPLITKLEDHGRENGCEEALVYGRFGWKRPLEKQGYRLHMCIYRKPL